MANISNKSASVLEISNRATVSKLENETLSGITLRLDLHESGLNASAHGIPNISGLQTTLNSKEDVFTKNTAFNKNFGTTTNTVCQGSDIRLSDARIPLTHTHVIGNITGLQTELDGKSQVFIGYTGSISVITDIDFTTQTTTTKVVTYSNGVVTSIV